MPALFAELGSFVRQAGDRDKATKRGAALCIECAELHTPAHEQRSERFGKSGAFRLAR